ncbi:MAG TPA: DUF1015 domain-containing protein [Deltaproteobacteria bacterium]|nr:DUF1015 domain-containing protein [Deltaproteobacteria bacterium]
MPRIRSFKGIRYNPDLVDLGNILCPPYDVIKPEKIDEYYDRSPYNAIRLVLGKQLPIDTKEDNRYSRARGFFRQWLEEGILIQDKVPSLYYHEHTYSHKDSTFTRKGFIASAHLDDDDKKSIRPHAYTQKGPKLDRLRLMNKVRTNFSSIFGIYSDPKKLIETHIRPSLSSPLAEFDDPEDSHRLWTIQDPSMIEQIKKMMQHKKILIADGHHRYETARIYRDRMRAATGKKDGNQSFDYIQMYLINKDEGINILPTHRVITDSMGVGLVDLEYRIKEIFNMIPHDNRKAFLNALSKRGRGSIGLYVRGIPRYYLLEFSGSSDIDRYVPRHTHPLLKNMDVTLLHECILEPILGIIPALADKRIMYTNNPEEALNMVSREKADIAFLLNPNTIDEILEIAEADLLIPQKSTCFHPKAPAGLVFHSLE